MGVRADGVPALDPTLEFMRLLWEIEHVLERASKRMGRSLDVTGPQRLVLRIVEQAPGITPKDLAEVVRLHPSTLTGVLRRLERKRLLRREIDARDRRRIRLSIRPRARRLTGRAEGTIESAVKQVLASESRVAVRHARQLLIHLAAALGELTPGGASPLAW